MTDNHHPTGPTMDIQRYLKDACSITIKHPLLMILGGLLIQILNLVSLSLLAGPLFAGYLLMVILYLRDERPPAFKDLFSGFKRFAGLFPYFGVILLIVTGLFLLIVPGLIFATWWIYTLPLMADRKMRLDDAMRLSRQQVKQKGFFIHLAFLLMITFIPAMLLNLLSTMLPLLNLLKILLPPLQVGCLAGLYLDTFADLEEEQTEEKPLLPGPQPLEPDAEPSVKEEIFTPGE
ncbi:MAG: hypothetical protein L3J03_02755 [Desulfobacterales bacterium]|nr:hypothetical protein [Desulfobacterales bacterium]